MFALRGVEPEDDEDLTFHQSKTMLIVELRYNLREAETWVQEATEQIRQEQAEHLATLPTEEERELVVEKMVSETVKYIVERDKHKVDKNKPI